MKPFLCMIACAAIALFSCNPIHAYEVSTHAALTREGFYASKLRPDTAATMAILPKLGIVEWSEDLGSHYVHIVNNVQRLRWSEEPAPREPEFARRYIREANQRSVSGSPTLPSVAAWLMLGSIREDDTPEDRAEQENNPQDDPEGPFIRVIHHFYDPFRDAALGAFQRAPDWAFAGFYFRHNGFSFTRARDAMWRALTLKDASGVDLPLPPGVATREEQRRMYWATTFFSLGSVAHLLQDMAQPQHTRGDAHSGRACGQAVCLAGHASFYEKYVDARIRGLPSFRLRDRWLFGDATSPPVIVTQPVFALTGYPVPAKSKFSEFFSTATGSGSLTGTGLANYSNQGFYSAGTNLGALIPYPSPPRSDAALSKVVIPDGQVENSAGDIVRGQLTLLMGSVSDHNAPNLTAANVRLSATGAFNQFLALQSKTQYSLNHYNYSDQATLLLPRAVAYSAGLFDYFFRGTMEVRPPPEGVYGIVDHKTEGCKDTCGFGKLKAIVRNKTPGETMLNGTLVAVVKFRRNGCYRSDLSGNPGGAAFNGNSCRSLYEEILVSNSHTGVTLAENAEASYTFTFPSKIPINASDVVLQIVYRGKLGHEADAVAVTTKDIGEPTFLGFANSSDFAYDFTNNLFRPVPWSVWDSTYNILQGKLKGTSGTVLATLDQLGVAEHAQVAYLADLGTVTLTYERIADRYSLWPYLPIAFPAVEFKKLAGTGSYASSGPVDKHRGVYRHSYFFATFPADTWHPCPESGEYCQQATLPALNPTNTKAWSIVF